eukprot:CCRYP_009441-RA/>CCRYP_009441-RA protein AED:0.47 eAED:0.47 QI:0/-1/0/1/-1/0/1/0/123
MRQGSLNQSETNGESNLNATKPFINLLIRLANIKIWLPYALNQAGSLLYYKLLASSRLTISVPICNATAMVFSCITSILLGERVDRPWRAGVGVLLIMLGSGICMMASENNASANGVLVKDEL